MGSNVRGDWVRSKESPCRYNLCKVSDLLRTSIGQAMRPHQSLSFRLVSVMDARSLKRCPRVAPIELEVIVPEAVYNCKHKLSTI